MAINLSEGILYTNPVPPQQWSRKLVSGTTYTDWASTGEIDAFFSTTPGLTLSFRNNKDFWISGKLYNYDGTQYREIGGSDVNSAVQSMNYTITADGNTVTIPGLIGMQLVMLMFANAIYDNSQIMLTSSTGTLNASEIGGFYNGNYLTILYKSL